LKIIGEPSEFVVLKERRLVNREVVKAGLLRFGFLLEITHPGSLPDAGLMAALLDLVISQSIDVRNLCMWMSVPNRLPSNIFHSRKRS